MKIQSHFTTNNSTITANHCNITQIATPSKSLSLTDRLTTQAKQLYAKCVTAKSVAEPRNSNLYKANSTPKACFFIRSTRTPKENTFPNFRERTFLSMVACNGKGFALCCIPCIAVFEPVTRYRPKASKLQAVALINQIQGLSSMIYKFLCLDREATDFRTQILTINATNEENARFSLTARWRLLATIAKNLPDNQPIAFTSAVEVNYG